MKTKYLIYIIIGLMAALSISIGRCSHNAQERDRLSDNQRSLLTEMLAYKVRDSLNAASIEKLTLSVSELKEHFPELKKDIEDLGVKVKRVEHVAQTATESKYHVETVIKDSLIYRRDTIERWIPLKCINFNNPYISLSGCEEEGLFKGSIKTVDTLLQVVHRVPRKFLFFKWGTKAVRQEVVSKNPYTDIVYSEYIELKR